MFPQSFLREEAKIKQRTSSKKALCKIGEEAIWESRFTSFLITLIFPVLVIKFKCFQVSMVHQQTL